MNVSLDKMIVLPKAFAPIPRIRTSVLVSRTTSTSRPIQLPSLEDGVSNVSSFLVHRSRIQKLVLFS